MKKILMRARMSPLDNFSAFEVLKNNYNGLNHIYKNKNEEVPLFDLKMNSLNYHKPIESITSVSADEISYRLENYYNFLRSNKNYIYV